MLFSQYFDIYYATYLWHSFIYNLTPGYLRWQPLQNTFKETVSSKPVIQYSSHRYHHEDIKLPLSDNCILMGITLIFDKVSQYHIYLF